MKHFSPETTVSDHVRAMNRKIQLLIGRVTRLQISTVCTATDTVVVLLLFGFAWFCTGFALLFFCLAFSVWISMSFYRY